MKFQNCHPCESREPGACEVKSIFEERKTLGSSFRWNDRQTGILFLSVFLLVSCQSQSDRVCFEKRCINVEVVSTPEAMKKGLQGRTSLSKNTGMLFVFSKPDHHLFWMKDTLIPLDLIWMDQERRIVHIRPDVQPCRAEPCETFGSVSRSAVYAVEVNAGYSAKHGLKKGDQAEFRLK